MNFLFGWSLLKLLWEGRKLLSNISSPHLKQLIIEIGTANDHSSGGVPHTWKPLFISHGNQKQGKSASEKTNTSHEHDVPICTLDQHTDTSSTGLLRNHRFTRIAAEGWERNFSLKKPGLALVTNHSCAERLWVSVKKSIVVPSQ